MSIFYTSSIFAPVASAFVEVAPSTLVGLFTWTFDPGPVDPIYVRPGNTLQQDLLNPDGAEWLLYTRSFLSYRIQVDNDTGANPSIGGASLIVEIGDLTGMPAGNFVDWKPFHLMSGNHLTSSGTGIELPGLVVRFRIETASDTEDSNVSVRGSIILRGI